jgi:hypothetical protein
MTQTTIDKGIPFGFIFHRTIDFYIAGWVVIGAAIGIWLIASQSADPALVASLVAVTTACGTAAYGIYMLRIKRAIIAAGAIKSDLGSAGP